MSKQTSKNRNPVLDEFFTEINKIYIKNEPESFFACEKAFSQLLDIGAPELLVRNELHKLSEEEDYSSPYFLDNGGLMLGGGEDTRLILERLPLPWTSTITEIIVDSFIAGVNNGFIAKQYITPENRQPECLDLNQKLTDGEIRSIKARTPLKIECMRETYDFGEESSNNTTYVLKFMGVNRRDFAWSYSRDTLVASRLSAGTIGNDALITGIQVLGSLGGLGQIETMVELLSHRLHNVRWEAAKAIAKLDMDEGIRQISKLTNDTHPEIRAAAQKTLSQIPNLK
jgi:hypothetical protein